MTRVCVTTLEQSVQTGDLILFSSKHAASHVTKCFTASTWDHCGIVVKLSPKHVFILEYAGGVYLYPPLHAPLLLLCNPGPRDLHPKAQDARASR